MNLIIQQLQADHRQLVRILYHLEREVKAYGGFVGGKGKLEKILDILDYIQVYPEIWHHPSEDIIYDVLTKKDAAAAAAVADILAEHEVLELLTENLLDYINQLATADSDNIHGIRMRFIKSTYDFVNRQLHHMEREQQQLFPLIDDCLGHDDWLEIKQRLKSLQPLLEVPLVQAYQSRYQAIASGSALTAH